MKRYFFFFALLLSWPVYILAQNNLEEAEQLIERLFQNQTEDINYEDFYDILVQYYLEPIDLNSTDFSGFLGLYILTPAEVQAILDYKLKAGPFISVYELQAVPGVTVEKIKEVMPFLTVTSSSKNFKNLWNNIIENPNQILIFRQSTRSSTIDQGHVGNNWQQFFRYKSAIKDQFSIGVTAEKDAGEAISWKKATKGADFYSAHLQIERLGKLENTIIGDFQPHFGQGLVFGGGWGAGKGAETITGMIQTKNILKPYTSVLESGFFRGITTTLPFAGSKYTVFLSQLRQDATRSQDTTFSTFDEFVSSIRVSGLHRTTAEIAAKNVVKETNVGLIFTHKIDKKTQIGLTTLATKYSLPIQKKPTLYNQFEFSGTYNWVGSVFFDASFWGFYTAGEIAKSKSGGTGIIGSIIFPLSNRVDLSFSGRWYEKKFHSFYSQGFSESSRLINENGKYLGLQYRPAYKHKISAFLDVFKFPWLTFRASSPSEGIETMFRYDWSFLKSSLITFQYRYEQKEQNFESEQRPLPTIRSVYRQQAFLNLDYTLLTNVSGRNRLQWNYLSTPDSKEHGWVVLQDINIKARKWQFSARYAIFNTDSYDTRNYLYERDLRYTYSVPAYSGTGIRWFVLVQKKLQKQWLLSAKYANTNFVNENNKTQELRLQVIYQPLHR